MLQKLETEIYWAIIDIDSRFTAGAVSMAQMLFAMATLRSILDRTLQTIEIPENAPVSVVERLRMMVRVWDCGLPKSGLRLSGLKAVNFGGKLCPTLLGQAVVELNASSVWLSYSHVSSPADVIQWHHRLAAILPPHVGVHIGGGALSPLIRRQLPKHTFYESLSSLLASEIQQRVRPPHFATSCPIIAPIPTVLQSLPSQFS